MRSTFGVPGIVALARAVADPLDRHRRHRAERRRVRRRDQRAGRRHQLFLHRAAVDRCVAEQLTVAGAGTGKSPCADCTIPPPTLSGEQTMRSAPTHSSANTAPTMSMMESRAPTSWRCTCSTGIWWIAASATASRWNSAFARSRPDGDSALLIDQREDFRQASMRVGMTPWERCVRMLVTVALIAWIVVRVLVIMIVRMVMTRRVAEA